VYEVFELKGLKLLVCEVSSYYSVCVLKLLVYVALSY
jgi:hypothetical protein